MVVFVLLPLIEIRVPAVLIGVGPVLVLGGGAVIVVPLGGTRRPRRKQQEKRKPRENSWKRRHGAVPEYVCARSTQPRTRSATAQRAAARTEAQALGGEVLAA